MRGYLHTVIFLVVFHVELTAQPQHYLFTHTGVKDGLHEENIHTVQQDASGYIWIASLNALQRYDGQRFIDFYHRDNDTLSIPAGGINGMLMDQKNRLWILTGKSTLGYMNVNDFKFHPVPVRLPPGAADKGAVLHIDKDGNVILIFVGFSFLTYNEARNEVAQQYNPFQLPAGWEPLFFLQDAARNYWIGTHQGLLKYSATKKMLSHRGHNEENDPIITRFEDMRTVVYAYVDKRNCFWLMAWHDNIATIKSYSIAGDEPMEWKNIILKAVHGKYFEMNGIHEFSDGSCWMAGHNIFARLNQQHNGLEAVQNDVTGEHNIRYDYIRHLFEDREKNIWISTDKGLYRFNPSAQLFRAVTNRLPGSDSVFTPDVTDLLQTTNGELLVSTWGNGIFSYDKYFNPVKSRYVSRVSPPGENMVWCMTQRKNGDIWRGNQDGYLFIYEAATGKTVRLRPPVFENSTIRQVEEDRDGNMWIGTQRGYLVKWNASTKEFIVHQQLKSIISRILIDDANSVWVCTDLNGVFRFNSTDGRQLARYTASGPKGKTLLINGASDIIQYNDSMFVIAANGLNLLDIRTNRIRHFGTDKGLPSANITNLAKDREGYIWMTSSAGISSYHPQKQKLSSYNETDGVHTNSFGVATGTILKEGQLAFGSTHDFIVFDPVRITVSDYSPPRVLVAGFSVMNQPLSVDSLQHLSRIKLQHFQHSIAIQLSTLTYQNIYIIYYMMEGLDKEWLPAGKFNQATYNYMRPGKYTFKTGCKDEKGKISQVTSLEIYIIPPFWKTWWFVSLLAFAAIGVLYWMDRLRIARIRDTERIRTRIATSLTRDMSSTLSSINMLSELAKVKADKDLERTKDYIGQISDSTQRMMEVMDDMIWSISPENDELQHTIVRMKKYAGEIQQRYSLEVSLTVDKHVSELKLQMDRRHELFLIFKEALANAGKHAHSRFADVDLRLEKSKLKMSITDNGMGFDTEAANYGRGIIEMRKKAAALNATLVIRSAQNSGTEVILEMMP